MVKIEITLEQKASLVIISFFLIVISAILFNFWENPVWIGFLIGTIIFWALIGLITFVSFLVKFIQYTSVPEFEKTEKEKKELEIKIKELENELKELSRD